jgi:hypothetical protein
MNELKPARTVEFAPDNTIIIDGEPLPWKVTTDGWGVYFYPSPFAGAPRTLTFAVLADNVTIGANDITVIDGHEVPWLLVEPPYVTVSKLAPYAVQLKVRVDTSTDEAADLDGDGDLSAEVIAA